MRVALLSLPLLIACKGPPPPAPEGLDASTAYMVRNFYGDDPTFQAGVQGFMLWFDTEGFELVGQAATTENTGSFVIGDLSAEDVAALPLADPIVLDESAGESGPRDLTRAKGVVSLADMACNWTVAEELLARPDQDVVFDDDFEGYDRTYLGDRAAYLAASQSLEFDPVDEPLVPFADGYDGSPYFKSVLQTDSEPDPKTVLTADIEPYHMHLDMRHGVFEVDEEPVAVLAIITWIDESAWGSGGNNGLIQQYSVEINVERPGDHTLRMLAVWAEPKGGGIEPDSAIALNYAVNKSLASSNRMSEVCEGEVEIPPEE